MNNYPRGSEWRRWDLHIHTPDSILCNNFGSDFDSYARQIFEKAIKEKIAVIGVTDYFTISGYKKLKQIQNERLSEILTGENIDKASKILLLPNIELRINVIVNSSKINFHIIFSDMVASEDIEQNFLDELRVTFEGNPQGTDETRKLSKRTLEQIGKNLKEHHEPFRKESDLYIGMMNAYVLHEEISKKLESNLFAGKYLLAVTADEDLSEISWDAQDHLTRKVLIQKSDFLFASNPKTIRWGLGKLGYDSPSKFENEFKSLKPCIHGSDAHSYNDLFCPREQRFCWIKADPTFEGLKQIICEPEERVRIQGNSPENDFEKLYFNNITANGTIIDGESVKFTNTNLELNKNLVAIIGGRGTGKSLLLDCLLKSFQTSDPKANDRLSKINPNYFKTEFTKSDGDIIQSSQEDIKGLAYLHVRQGEIKDIAMVPEALGNKIKKLLGINYDEESYDEDIENIKTIDKINQIKQWLQQKDKNDNFINTEDHCNNVITYYKNLISNITAKDTQDAINDYKQNQQIASQDIVYINAINTKINEIQNFQESLNQFLDSLNFYSLGDSGTQLKTWDFSKIITPLTEYKIKLENRKNTLIKLNEEIKNRLIDTGINQDISTLLEKVQELQKNLIGFENHKKTIIVRTQEREGLVSLRNSFIDSIKEELEKEKDNIDSSYQKLKQGKPGWSEDQKDLVNSILNDIDISAEIVFNKDAFYDGIWKILNGTKFRTSVKGNGQEKMRQIIGVHTLEDFYSLANGSQICSLNGDKDANLDNICEQYDLFLAKTSYSLYEYIYLKQYYGNYLTVIPALTYKAKPPEKLSVGQRGTFYLCLRLATDPFGSPFVFDQPEDDLDNEFITDTLVPIFKKIKKYRQVIIATHNANLVVNADAEQVVVAENREETLEYTSGSLENKAIKNDVCRILEGGKSAFIRRENKYGFDYEQ